MGILADAAGYGQIERAIQDREAQRLATIAIRQVQEVLDETVAGNVADVVATAWTTANQMAWFGFLPLAFALLVLHEHWNATSNNQPYRVGYVLLRVGVAVGLLLKYGLLIKLITYAAGGGSNYANWSNFFGWVDGFSQAVATHFVTGGVFGAVFWLIIFLVLLLCSLFAYIVLALIAFSQATLLLLLFTLGKTCIVCSIVPGVGLGKSWAKMLAMVAAWSTIAGVLTGGFQDYAHSIVLSATSGQMMDAITLAGKICVHAIILGSTPWITSALFSGMAAMAPGFAQPLSKAVMGAKMLGAKLNAVGGLGAAMGAMRRATGGGGGQGGAAAQQGRVHKAQKSMARSASAKAASANAAPRSAHSKSLEGAQAAARWTRYMRSAPSIPKGSPGRSRFTSHPGVGIDARAAHSAKHRATPMRLAAPPAQTPGLSRRVAENQPTLRAAYPEHSFNPDSLSPAERAIVSELDSDTGRFAGWERGAQGADDFNEAAMLASRRVASQNAPADYNAPANLERAASLARNDEHRVYGDTGPDGPSAGDVVLPRSDGTPPDSARLVPHDKHRAEAPDHMTGDAQGAVEYYAWKEGNPAEAGEQRAAHQAWKAERDVAHPNAAQDWSAHRAVAQRAAPSPAAASPVQSAGPDTMPSPRPKMPAKGPHPHLVSRQPTPAAGAAPTPPSPSSTPDQATTEPPRRPQPPKRS